MARDNIKAIIEKGKKMPAHEAINSLPNNLQSSKKPVKVDRAAIAEQPRQRTQVNPHRTLRGTRK